MEKDIINLILEQYGETLINDYRRELYDGGTNCTGRLSNSLRYIIESDEDVFDLYLALEDYWKYVEYGRQPGRFPNISAIEQWIKDKPVIPQPFNGKVPSIKQLTYLISRKIANEGIQPKNYLQNALDQIDLKPLEDAITRAIESKLDDTLEEL